MPTYEEMKPHLEKIKKEREEDQKRYHEIYVSELKKQGIDITQHDYNSTPQKRYDHPNTIEDGTATFFWIVSLIVGALFKGAWIIWIVSTIIWLRFITRHSK